MTQSNTELDDLFSDFISHINSNPDTSNYIGREDDKTIAKAKAQLQRLITEARREALEKVHKEIMSLTWANQHAHAACTYLISARIRELSQEKEQL